MIVKYIINACDDAIIIDIKCFKKGVCYSIDYSSVCCSITIKLKYVKIKVLPLSAIISSCSTLVIVL